MTDKERLLKLRIDLHQHNVNYYINDKPTLSDITFDELLKELEGLELKYPEWSDINSPTGYANALTEVQHQIYSYVRDSTGLRDMTTGGLKGVLNPPGVFELYQKPTGGALVSLDPGWGPD